MEAQGSTYISKMFKAPIIQHSCGVAGKIMNSLNELLMEELFSCWGVRKDDSLFISQGVGLIMTYNNYFRL